MKLKNSLIIALSLFGSYHSLNAEVPGNVPLNMLSTDSLGREKITQGMADFEVKYKTQTKELEIAQLQKQMLERETIFLRIGMMFLLVFLCVLFILLHLRHRQQKIRKQLEMLRQEKELASARSYIEGMEKECKFFAKELHDGIANDLLGLQMKVETSKHTEGCEELPSLIRKIRDEVRNISHELMPPEFEQQTLQQILRAYVTKTSENTGRQISLVYAEKDDVDIVLPDSVSRAIYRIIQEMIANIVKHSSATQIVIILNVSQKGNSELSISDNGQPWQEVGAGEVKSEFEQGNADARQVKSEFGQGNADAGEVKSDIGQVNSGIGLRTIQDRIRAIGGTVRRSVEDGKNVFTLTFKERP